QRPQIPHDDSYRRRVYPPIPAPLAASPSAAHSPLRPVCGAHEEAQSRTMPGASVDSRRKRPPIGGTDSGGDLTHSGHSPPLSRLSHRHHGSHRTDRPAMPELFMTGVLATGTIPQLQSVVGRGVSSPRKHPSFRVPCTLSPIQLPALL